MTPEEVKQRLEEAGKTLLMLPMPKHGRPQEYGNNWPDILRSATDYWGASLTGEDDPDEARWRRQERTEAANRVRLGVSQQQIRELDEVLSWFWYIKDEEIRGVVMSRTLVYFSRRPVSWARLGRRFHRDERTMRRWFCAGIEIIVSNINNNVRLDCPDMNVYKYGT